MKSRCLTVLFVVAVSILVLPSIALAQDDPQNSVTFAYAYLKVNGDDHSGFAVDFNRDLKTHGNVMLRGVGQFAFLHGAPRDIVIVAGGAQVAFTNLDRIVPFGQITAGALNASNLSGGGTSFALNYDVGADIKINDEDKWRVRVLFGWTSILGDNSETGWRFAAGGQRRF